MTGKTAHLQTRFDAPERVELGGLAVDFVAHRACWRGRPITLGPNELRLLGHFLGHPDRVYSRASLIFLLGKTDLAIDERTVDVWVGRLRRALRRQGVPDRLRTVRLYGYVFDSIASPGTQP